MQSFLISVLIVKHRYSMSGARQGKVVFRHCCDSVVAGEKPYKCPTCPYSACRRDMITRHLRTHSRYSLGLSGASTESSLDTDPASAAWGPKSTGYRHLCYYDFFYQLKL